MPALAHRRTAVTRTPAMTAPVTKHVIDETYIRRWRTTNWWGYEPLGSHVANYFPWNVETKLNVVFNFANFNFDKTTPLKVEAIGMGPAKRHCGGRMGAPTTRTSALTYFILVIGFGD